MALLIDHFLNISKPEFVPGAEPFVEFHKIARKSEVFVFGPDAFEIYKKFKDKMGETLSSMLPLCRTPYPSLWVEFTENHETVSMGVDGAAFLIVSQNPAGTIWKVMFGQKHSDNKKFIVQPVIPTVDISDPGNPKFSCVTHPDNDQDEAFRMQGHISACAATCLAMLNCRNLLEPVPVKPPIYQREFRHYKKHPFVEYKWLTLKLTKSQRNAAEAQGMSETELRAHLVRGHFKQRKTGLYWWSPYVRGNSDLGWIEKGYKVEK